jgi:NitT/TauT family transport system substrate-binding protein
LAATTKAFDEAMKNPEVAIEALVAARPGADKELLLEQLKRTPPYLHTKNSAGKRFGYMAPADWDETLKFMKQAFEFKADVKASDIYTNDFLPKQ